MNNLYQSILKEQKKEMESLEQKIANENKLYDKLKDRYYVAGAIFVVIGVILGIMFSQTTQMDPTIAGLSIALYLGFGVSVLMKSITVKEDRKRSIREIEMDEKINKIASKLDSTSIQIQSPQPTTPIDVSQLSDIIEEWKVVVQTQMHFNDLLMKVRTATLSVVLAIFGAAGYSILSKDTFLLTINEFAFHPSAIIISSGIVILISMFIIDYRYYYKMLIGAVRRGIEFDEEFGDKFGRKYFGMTTMIRDEIGEKGASKKFVILFYTIPIISGIAFLFTILIGFPT